MVWNQFGDFFVLYPDPHSSNFMDPNHWKNGFNVN